MSFGSIGIGMVLPCMDTLLTEGIEKEQRGTITSLYSSMRFIGVSLGPPAVSLLMGGNRWALFGTLAGVSLLGGLLSLFAVKPESKGARVKARIGWILKSRAAWAKRN